MTDAKREMPKMIKNRRVIIPLSDENFDHLAQMAWRNQVSIAYLANLAVLKLLLSDAKGEFSLVPEFQPEREIPRA